LIEDRAGGNQLRKTILSVSLTDEVSSTIETAARIQMPGYGKININTIEILLTRVEYRFTYRIEFERRPKNSSRKKERQTS
jgi:hypothetical protein